MSFKTKSPGVPLCLSVHGCCTFYCHGWVSRWPFVVGDSPGRFYSLAERDVTHQIGCLCRFVFWLNGYSAVPSLAICSGLPLRDSTQRRQGGESGPLSLSGHPLEQVGLGAAGYLLDWQWTGTNCWFGSSCHLYALNIWHVNKFWCKMLVAQF